MPRIKQRKVAQKLIENVKLAKPLTAGEIVESSGYGPSMKKNPQVVINSQGVKEALEEYGFTEDNAKKVVAKILLNDDTEPNARLKAADQVFKVHGSYAPEKSVNLNVEVEASPEVKGLTEKLNELYAGTGKPSDGGQSSSLGDKAQDKE